MPNWIICPLRNGLHLTRDALKTFLAQDIGDVQVLFLDNSSTDGTGPWLRSIVDDRVSAVFANPPKSVAASWNMMLKLVFSKGAEYALTVNNDVLLRPDTYRHLVADGGPFTTAVGTVDKTKIEPPYIEPDPAMKRCHPDFSAYLIRRECYEEVGDFSERCDVAYTEDSDYHVRMHQAGITAMALELPFWHLGAGTIKNSDPAEVKAIQQAADRNRKRFKDKYGVEVGSPQYYSLFGHGAPE